MSDLIQIITDDRSATVSTVVGATGATVIDSTRGGNEPVYFAPKQTSKIINYFGIPDTGNEAVDDVIAYNNKYPIWVSAPSTGGKYGGVLATSTGLVPFIGGKTAKTMDFSAIENTVLPGQTPNGTEVTFTYLVTNHTFYVPQSIKMKVNGVLVPGWTATNADVEMITTTPDIGEGSFTRGGELGTLGAFSFTFDTAPVTGTKIEIIYSTDYSDSAYFALFNKNAQVDDLSALVTLNDDDDFIISLNKLDYQTNTMKPVYGFPVIGSTVLNKKNGYGINIYMPELFKNSDYITAVVNTGLTVNGFTDGVTATEFVGGVRGTTDSAQLTVGWDYFKNASKYRVDVFFDTTADDGVPAIFETLRNSYQKYSYYICPLPNEDAATAITTALGVMTDNKGIAFYWNWGIVLNGYTGSTMASSLMGRRALRLADMYDVFNGLAPAWYNENGTHGGQLGSGIVEMFYDADDATQQLLSDARINPTVLHPTFGVVNTRERTSQSLNSDFASIGHTRLADYFLKNILNQVLPYQLYKLNDYNHRTIVKSQIEKIISPTKTDPYNLLRDFIVKCDDENNNDEVLAREEFVVSVGIKFTPFSKFIKLYFINAAQGTSVSEVV